MWIFENVRAGRGGSFDIYASLNATNHLVFEVIDNTTWLNVDDAAGTSRRLFTAHVQRVRANYTFTARSFVRLIGQYVSTDRDPSLYHPTNRRARRHVQRVGAARVQDQLAVGDVRRLRR